jgi:cellulose synthase/poly-beta-1,6-N-acetylglucosamine synthase-like glycosyltransferase
LLIFYIDAIMVIISWLLFIFSSLLLIYAIRSIIIVIYAKKFDTIRPDSDDDAAINNKKVVRKYPPNGHDDGKKCRNRQLPFISILVATYNESAVIDRFLKSF